MSISQTPFYNTTDTIQPPPKSSFNKASEILTMQIDSNPNPVLPDLPEFPDNVNNDNYTKNDDNNDNDDDDHIMDSKEDDSVFTTTKNN